MRAWAWLAGWALIQGCSCGGDGDGMDAGGRDSGIGGTALLVAIEAEDGVMKSGDALEIEVRIAADRTGLDVVPVRDTTRDDAPVGWPGMVLVEPAAGEESAFVEVAARVVGRDGSTYVRGKIRTQFIPTLTLEAVIRLDDLCPGVECASGETCADGDCKDAFVDPTTLVPSRRDAGMDPDGSMRSDVPGVDAALPPTCPDHAAVVRADAGNRHTCAILEGGALWCWGSGEDGRTGLADAFVHASATRVGSMTFSEVSAGARSTCAVGMDGSLWCWGYNSDGQVGDGTLTSRNVPTRVVLDPMKLPGTAISWTEVAVGALFACGLDVMGVLRCWGDGSEGQLALGTMESHTEPTAFDPMVMPVEQHRGLAAGAQHAGAFVVDGGELVLWGSNGAGQLGDADTSPHTRPVAAALPGGMTADAVGVGDTRTCVVTSGGALLCTADGFMPIDGATDWASVAVGAAHVCAIKLDGSLWCFGEGGEGQLGQGDTMDHAEPVRVAGGPWTSVTVAMGHTCGVAMDGRLWCWGRGLEGQLGQGDTLPQRRPHEVCFE